MRRDDFIKDMQPPVYVDDFREQHLKTKISSDFSANKNMKGLEVLEAYVHAATEASRNCTTHSASDIVHPLERVNLLALKLTPITDIKLATSPLSELPAAHTGPLSIDPVMKMGGANTVPSFPHTFFPDPIFDVDPVTPVAINEYSYPVMIYDVNRLRSRSNDHDMSRSAQSKSKNSDDRMESITKHTSAAHKKLNPDENRHEMSAEKAKSDRITRWSKKTETPKYTSLWSSAKQETSHSTSESKQEKKHMDDRKIIHDVEGFNREMKESTLGKAVDEIEHVGKEVYDVISYVSHHPIDAAVNVGEGLIAGASYALEHPIDAATELIPGVSTLKYANEFCTGCDPITNEPVSRVGATVGLVLSLFDLAALSKVSIFARCARQSEENAFARQVSTGGLRNETPLNIKQKADAIAYAKSLGVPDDALVISDSMNTSYKYLFGVERLYIGTDVLPGVGQGLTANSRITMRGAIAHEVIGHRAAEIEGMTHSDPLLEEVQASIRAARYAPEISSTERITLLRDAIERLWNAGLRIKDVRNDLWLDQIYHPKNSMR
jgi:hypothetical protein